MLTCLKATTPRAWWQDTYVSCYANLSAFCGIIRLVSTTPYRATAARVGRTNGCLIQVPDKEGQGL